MIVTGLSLKTLSILVGSVVALHALQLFLDFRRLLASIKWVNQLYRIIYIKLIILHSHLPEYRTIISPSSALTPLLPRIPLLTLGHDHSWLSKHGRTSNICCFGPFTLVNVNFGSLCREEPRHNFHRKLLATLAQVYERPMVLGGMLAESNGIDVNSRRHCG
jgi:hypothetical protein